MNGRELTLSWHELRAALWHPLFVALVLVIVGLIISLGPYDAFLGLHPLEKTLFYANGVAERCIPLRRLPWRWLVPVSGVSGSEFFWARMCRRWAIIF